MNDHELKQREELCMRLSKEVADLLVRSGADFKDMLFVTATVSGVLLMEGWDRDDRAFVTNNFYELVRSMIDNDKPQFMPRQAAS